MGFHKKKFFFENGHFKNSQYYQMLDLSKIIEKLSTVFNLVALFSHILTLTKFFLTFFFEAYGTFLYILVGSADHEFGPKQNTLKKPKTTCF
jgi:hypothetical protein